jgi:phage terminase large subunit-like protein
MHHHGTPLRGGASPDRLDALVWAIGTMLSDRYWDGPQDRAARRGVARTA